MTFFTNFSRTTKEIEELKETPFYEIFQQRLKMMNSGPITGKKKKENIEKVGNQ